MTRGSLIRLIKALPRNDRGNVPMLTAIGLPALVGAAGFAVERAQWYLSGRELQIAVDATALSGALPYAQIGVAVTRAQPGLSRDTTVAKLKNSSITVQ